MKNTIYLLLLPLLWSCGPTTTTDEEVTDETNPMEDVAVEPSTPAIGFDHYAIIVSDLERAANFYLDVVGLEEIENATGKPNIRWFGLGGALGLHVIEHEDAATLEKHKSHHLALTVPNLDDLVSKMREMEYPFENWPGVADTTNLRADGVEQIYFKDPDGYWIEVNDAVKLR